MKTQLGFWSYGAGIVAGVTLILLSPNPVIARTVNLEAPDSAAVGAELPVAFSGESSPNDFITVVAAGEEAAVSLDSEQ